MRAMSLISISNLNARVRPWIIRSNLLQPEVLQCTILSLEQRPSFTSLETLLSRLVYVVEHVPNFLTFKNISHTPATITKSMSKFTLIVDLVYLMYKTSVLRISKPI